jgi:hypothetical protein
MNLPDRAPTVAGELIVGSDRVSLARSTPSRRLSLITLPVTLPIILVILTRFKRETFPTMAGSLGRATSTRS